MVRIKIHEKIGVLGSDVKLNSVWLRNKRKIINTVIFQVGFQEDLFDNWHIA